MTKQHYNGFVALISVVVLGAFLMVIIIGFSFRSYNQSIDLIGDKQSRLALSMSDTCVEYAFSRLIDDEDYLGDSYVIIGTQVCHILPITSSGGSDRIIEAESTFIGVGEYTKRVHVEISDTFPIKIDLWQEVASF